jgi:hypothetical protein
MSEAESFVCTRSLGRFVGSLKELGSLIIKRHQGNNRDKSRFYMVMKHLNQRSIVPGRYTTNPVVMVSYRGKFRVMKENDTEC